MYSKDIDYQSRTETDITYKDKTKMFKILLIVAGCIIIILLITIIVLAAKNSSSKKNYFTSKVFMIKPICFGFNEETADTNPFQKEGFEKEAQEKALQESNDFIKLLTENDITVIQVEDTIEPKTPDSIFPNNWFSTHEEGTLVLYPMLAENRRAERKQIFLDVIKKILN